MEIVVGHLSKAGFVLRDLQPLAGPYAPVEQFTDHKLLDDRTFQDGDSFFSMAREQGLLEQYLTDVREMADCGSLSEHISRSEERRKQIGIAYLLCAEKI